MEAEDVYTMHGISHKEFEAWSELFTGTIRHGASA